MTSSAAVVQAFNGIFARGKREEIGLICLITALLSLDKTFS